MKTISRLALVLTLASTARANGPEPVLVNAGIGNEPARPLEGRGLDDLIAFTRLLG
jgi:hypothetical protein